MLWFARCRTPPRLRATSARSRPIPWQRLPNTPADIILLGPQVRYRLKEVQGQLPNNKVEVIDMKDYGMMNGKGVLDHVRKVLEG